MVVSTFFRTLCQAVVAPVVASAAERTTSQSISSSSFLSMYLGVLHVVGETYRGQAVTSINTACRSERGATQR